MGSSKPEIEVGSKEYQDTNKVYQVRFTAVSDFESMSSNTVTQHNKALSTKH